MINLYLFDYEFWLHCLQHTSRALVIAVVLVVDRILLVLGAQAPDPSLLLDVLQVAHVDECGVSLAPLRLAVVNLG